MTVNAIVPAKAVRKVAVRSFDDIAGYEHSMRLATTSMTVREAPNFNGWHVKIDLGRVRLNSAEYSASLSTRSTVRWPRFFFLTGNGRPARVSGKDFDRGMINYMAEFGDVSMVSDKHMAWTSIEFDPELLGQDFPALTGNACLFGHGAMFLGGGTAAWNRLTTVCRNAIRVGMTDENGFNGNSAATSAAGALIEAVTECITDSRREADRAAAGHHHAILRRMVDAIEEDHRSAVTLASLCMAANASAATLERVSLEFLGMTPGQYLRNHRLRRLHETLRRADPGSTTVAAAMAGNGIWENSQAAATYLAMFGQTPAETLHKPTGGLAVLDSRARVPRRRA